MNLLGDLINLNSDTPIVESADLVKDVVHELETIVDPTQIDALRESYL